MKKHIAFLLGFFSLPLCAESITVTMYSTGDKQENRGVILFEKSPGGLMIKPNLHDLPPGPHGFHIHHNPNCGSAGMAAGGHLDPAKTNLHQGPYEDDSHLGDLPILYVNADGEARTALLAPRLTIKDISGHSVMIHAGGDNYSNIPPNGGGGPRIACGVIR